MEELKADCRNFISYIPCVPHKKNGVHCSDCGYYDPVKERYLIIKLGAIGDVIRTTPLLRKIKAVHPHAEIWWLTHTPEILPDIVDRKLKFNLSSSLQIEETKFDFVFSLDKDFEAAAIANRAQAKIKKGFIFKDGKTFPIDKAAESKFLTGLFDDVNRANAKSYPEEVFEICGYEFSGEEYMLPNFAGDGYKWELSASSPKVGLNTGCGERWTSRLVPEATWIETARALKAQGFEVVLLGGKQEHERNLAIAEKSGAFYPGYFPLRQFINFVDQMDLVITCVTMGLHIAIGLGKKVVLINNIFNPREFELYDRGDIVQPDKACHCYFSPQCVNQDYFCLNHLPASKIVGSVSRLLGYAQDRKAEVA